MTAGSLIRGVLIGLLLTATASGAAAGDRPRVVSIGGAVTDVVAALGAVDRLVAIDSTSRYPASLRDLPDIGYMRHLAAEPILALEPTLILAVADSGPASALAQLRASGVTLVIVPDDPTVEGTLQKVDVVAEALGLQEEGRKLRARIEAELAASTSAVEKIKERPGVLFLLSIGTGTPLAAGRETAANGIIQLSGGRNAIDGFTGYRPLSPEAAVEAAPEVLLLSTQGLEMIGGEAGLLALPQVAVTPAAEQRRVVTLEGQLLLGFGPRTGAAILELARYLHPDADLPAPTSSAGAPP
jgi:iron complex transport system substrate-binding protein